MTQQNNHSSSTDPTTSNSTNCEKWLKTAKKELKNKSIDSLTTNIQGGITYKPLYTKDDILNDFPIENSQYPGTPPFLRGPRATMYTNRPWTIRQYSGFSSAQESNQFYRKNLSQGQKGLSVAFDLPTHRGYNSDHPLAKADVGKAGVAIDSVEDMKVLFEKIPLDQITVSMTINGAVLPILACYIVCAQEQGVDQTCLRGTIQNDILKEYLVRNTYIYPPQPSMDIVTDIICYVSKHMPHYNPISISGYHMHEAGADCVTELAYTLANGLEYIRHALSKGLTIDQFAPRLSFFFAIGMNFFVEIAKLRAARILWHNLIKEKFAPTNQKSLMLRVHCQTSGYSLTAQDPHNNIIRTTIEAMSAILGGTQSLHTNSFDEALALPTEFSAKIARNTQLILEHETDITYSADPLAGSYLVENLTQQLVNSALTCIEKIENHGGMLKAIEYGFVKERIERCASLKQARLDSKQDILVGVNDFYSAFECSSTQSTQQNHRNDHDLNLRHIDLETIQAQQFKSLAKVKKNRDNQKVKTLLNKIYLIAKKKQKLSKKYDNQSNSFNKSKNDDLNLMPAVIEAIRHRATIGEVSDTLEKVYHRYSSSLTMVNSVYLNTNTDNKQIKQIFQKIEKFTKKHGRRPRILLVKLGQDGHDRGIKVVAGGLSDLGFDIDLASLFLQAEHAAKQAMENDVHFIGVSSLAGGHLVLVKDLKNQLSLINCNHIKIFVGGIIPKKDYQALYQLGCSEIFTQGTTITQCASILLDLLLDDNKQYD